MGFDEKFLIGMVHLKPLPGSFKYSGNFGEVVDHAVEEAVKLEEAGFDAVLVENFRDVPYSKTVDPITVSSMSVIGEEVDRRLSIPFGVNVLRNDSVSSYSIAYAVDADFIRVNVLSGVAFTDQGVIEGSADDLAEVRNKFSDEISVFADVHVKHADHFSSFDEAIEDTVERGLADGVVISGKRTGSQVDFDRLERAYDLSSVPVLIGSGVSKDNISDLWEFSDGFIVGTSLKENGVTDNDVDVGRASEFMDLVDGLRDD